MDEKIAIILAAGDYPTAPEALAYLDSAEYVCCCDGAAQALIDHGRMPDAIVGDGDSLTPEQIERFGSLYHRVTEQEYNDLTKATRYCIAQGYHDIVYLGATGKREDHTLANIALMAFYKRELGINPTMVTDYGTFVVGGNDDIDDDIYDDVKVKVSVTTFHSFPGQQVSIFNLGCTTLESEGLKWDAYPYRELWQGTLNEALSYSFTIKANGPYIIFRTHKAKGER